MCIVLPGPVQYYQIYVRNLQTTGIKFFCEKQLQKKIVCKSKELKIFYVLKKFLIHLSNFDNTGPWLSLHFVRKMNIFVAGMDEDEEVVEKRKRKRKREGDSEDDLLHIMDELPTEKSLQCQVHLLQEIDFNTAELGCVCIEVSGFQTVRISDTLN